MTDSFDTRNSHFDICHVSVQAMRPDGAAATRFDVPAPVIFPNLDGLDPGEKALFFSFNHAAGRWDVIGAGTATTNGTIETDPATPFRPLSSV